MHMNANLEVNTFTHYFIFYIWQEYVHISQQTSNNTKICANYCNIMWWIADRIYDTRRYKLECQFLHYIIVNDYSTKPHTHTRSNSHLHYFD